MSRPHRARRIACLSLLVFVRTATVAVPRWSVAQVTARTTGNELRDMVSDVGYLMVSPFQADGGDWAAAAFTGAGFVALLAVDKPVDAWVVRHPNAAVMRMLTPFREEHGALNRLVTARQLVPLSAALVVVGAATGRRGLREAGLGCMGGWAVSNLVRYATYAGISRSRPSTGADPLSFAIPGGSWDEHSFFAGHTTNAFVCASFWSSRFELGVAEPVLYAGAIMTGLSRIADRRHWTSDTFVGTVVGIAIGHTLARRYVVRDEPRPSQPVASPRGAAPAASNRATIAPRHSRLARPGPTVILWRAAF